LRDEEKLSPEGFTELAKLIEKLEELQAAQAVGLKREK